MEIKKVVAGAVDELPKHIKPGDVVLDVGGGMRPFSRADYVLDFLAWGHDQQKDPYLREDRPFKDIWPKPHFSRERWVQMDICSRQPWPFRDKQFDFVVCRHTLEDLRDPIWVCQELQRVARRGYIETPSRIVESLPGVERSRYCGFSHHRWLCELTSEGMEFMFKPAQLHGYSRFHLTVGPEWHRSRRDHHWSEAFDGVEGLWVIANRWFRELNQRYAVIGMYWTDSFMCREKVLIGKSAVEADLMAFKERCRSIPDLWIWKRTWYGKRVQH